MENKLNYFKLKQHYILSILIKMQTETVKGLFWLRMANTCVKHMQIFDYRLQLTILLYIFSLY